MTFRAHIDIDFFKASQQGMKVRKIIGANWIKLSRFLKTRAIDGWLHLEDTKITGGCQLDNVKTTQTCFIRLRDTNITGNRSAVLGSCIASREKTRNPTAETRLEKNLA